MRSTEALWIISKNPLIQQGYRPTCFDCVKQSSSGYSLNFEIWLIHYAWLNPCSHPEVCWHTIKCNSAWKKVKVKALGGRFRGFSAGIVLYWLTLRQVCQSRGWNLKVKCVNMAAWREKVYSSYKRWIRQREDIKVYIVFISKAVNQILCFVSVHILLRTLALDNCKVCCFNTIGQLIKPKWITT